MGFSWCLLLLSHLTYKVALILAATRLFLYWVLRHMSIRVHRLFDTQQYRSSSSSNCDSSSYGAAVDECQSTHHMTSYEGFNVAGRRLHVESSSCETCAVCLNELRDNDKVRELRNCCHVFHRDCINRWLDHDDQKTCPLCRTPLLLSSSSSSSSSMPRPSTSNCSLGTSTTMTSRPSWAVEQLLYLFGDDLL